jgi:hypothetical protein
VNVNHEQFNLENNNCGASVSKLSKLTFATPKKLSSEINKKYKPCGIRLLLFSIATHLLSKISFVQWKEDI